MVSAIAKNPGSCDEVWLCNLSGKPTLKKSEEYIEEKLLPVAELFRSKGITVSLQIAETVSFPKNITKRWGEIGTIPGFQAQDTAGICSL